MTQTICRRLGETGCYLLSIHEAARRLDPVSTPDPIATYEHARAMGWIREDCFVLRPDLVIGWLTGQRWIVEHRPVEYRADVDEIEILRLERRGTLRTDAHFVLGDGAGNLMWDPEGMRQLDYVGRGWEVVSKRIFRRVS